MLPGSIPGSILGFFDPVQRLFAIDNHCDVANRSPHEIVGISGFDLLLGPPKDSRQLCVSHLKSQLDRKLIEIFALEFNDFHKSHN